MPSPLSKTLVIQQPDGTVGEKYDLVVDEDGKLQFSEQSVGEGITAGEPVSRKWTFWGGGMGQIRDLQQGGYYYAKNCFVGNPWVIRPRPTKTTVTLTDNATPVVRFFEAQSASGTKYLYALTETMIYKVDLGTMTLVNTKDLTENTVNFKTGSYTGTGSAISVTGLGFQPDCVIFRDGLGNPANILVTGMTGWKEWTGLGNVSATGSLDADGFTVSSSVDGRAYYWIAWDESAGYLDVGTYSGDGNATQAITGVGFQADLLWIFDAASVADDAEVVSRHSTHNDDETIVYHDAATSAACVHSLDADGFTVNNDTRVNASGHTYYYVAFKALAGHFTVGTYTGDGTDDQDLGDVELDPDVEYTPEYMIISRYGTSKTVHRSDKNSGDSSMYFSATANAANLIQLLQADGCQVGDAANVNANGVTYHYAAWVQESAQSVSCGQPAKWNGIWEVPLGDDVDWIGLTTIADGTDDDTWTTRTDLKATHFCRVDNKLARALNGRTIELCSEDDVSVAGNWASTYYVGDPGTVITQLVEWQDELAVITEDGFYMFDGVAVAKQQLPLMGGVSDEDNGKGAINWMLQILIGTSDGFLRWSRDAAPKGPDSIPGYTNAEDTSDEPVRLHHYGSAFLQDWIYNAAKDPSDNYHIFTLQPKDEDFQWDNLLTSTSAITMLHVDSERHLWFNYGNNIAYIELHRGGEPGAGTFGEASTVGSFYLPEVTLADEADVRLRVVKVRVRNSKSNFSWSIYASRDGGTAAVVGSTITADGETCCYFAPASNLTAKRLRLILVWGASGAYTPTSDPPEVISIEVWGEAMPAGMDEIRATVDLESDDRAQSTNYNALKAHENAGIRVLRHPITDEEIYVTIYKEELFDVLQRGNEEPTGAMLLHMRRADTS